MNIVRLVIGFSFLFLGLDGHSQPPLRDKSEAGLSAAENHSLSSLTLNEAIKESDQGSLVAQKAQANFEEAKFRKEEAYMGFLPALSASLNYLGDKKYMLLDTTIGGNPITIPQVVPTTQYTLRATLPLFDGFASRHRLRAGEANQEAALHDFDWVKFSVARQVILQFYRSLAAQVILQVAEQNLLTLTDHLRDVHAFKKAGVSTNYDVLRVEVQVSEAQSELLNAKDNLEIAKFKLGEVLGKEVETRSLVGSLPVLTSQDIAEKPLNLGQRKDLQALREKRDASQWLSQSAGRYWVPKLSLFAEAQYYNNKNDRFSDSESFRNGYLLGLNLTWNIFDGMVSLAKSGQARQQLIQIEKSVQIAENRGKQDLEIWTRKFKYFCAVYQARVGDVGRSQELVRLAKEGRRAGTRTNTDLLDAEAELFRAQAGRLNSQIGAIEALINLELATGQSFYDFK